MRHQQHPQPPEDLRGVQEKHRSAVDRDRRVRTAVIMCVRTFLHTIEVELRDYL
jgi:hypothetical protein